MIDLVENIQWHARPAPTLESLAPAWSVVDFFAEAPLHLHGSLLLALTRARALLVAFTDGRNMLLIHFQDAAAVWVQDGQERCSSVQRVRVDNVGFMAFMPLGSGEALQSLAHGPLTLDVAVSSHVDVRIGAHTRITCLPASRSWDWAWGPTLGPVFLSLYLDRSREQIREWLRKNLPSGYVFDQDCVRSTRNPNPEGGLRHSDEIRYSAGEIHFVHGYYRHVQPVDNARAIFLLRKLVAAELGELSFDLVDGDYGSLCASGYDGASLGMYLDRRP